MSNKGGARPGAGRPKMADDVSFLRLKLPTELRERLEGLQEHLKEKYLSVMIRDAIEEYIGKSGLSDAKLQKLKDKGDARKLDEAIERAKKLKEKEEKKRKEEEDKNKGEE